MKTNRIICDDCIERMRRFPDNYFDSIVTDPPYGLGFMGKDWDTFKKSYIPSAPEKYARVSTEYGRVRSDTGRPFMCGRETPAAVAGSYDYSRNTEFQQWFTLWATEALRVCKPGALMLIFGGTRTYHRLTCTIEDAGWQIRDCFMWLYGSGFPKSTSISQQFDKVACREQLEKELGRKPTGKEFKKAWEGFRRFRPSPNSRSSGASPSGCYGEGIQTKTIDEPQTNLAKLWDGYGTALKPAWEPIVVAMKPLDGTFAANAEKWEVAGMNINGSRIETEKRTTGGMSKKSKDAFNRDDNWEPQDIEPKTVQGRWPANLILDPETATMLDKQTGNLGKSSGGNIGVKGNKVYGKYGDSQKGNPGFGDTGGASRFFYCAKASKSERNAGLEGMPKEKADKRSDAAAGLWTKMNAIQENNHPTVKPLALMGYLCKLLKPPTKHPILLDPFCGSGTTLIAALNTGWQFIGIEKEPDYCKIARARVRVPLIRYRIKQTKARNK